MRRPAESAGDGKADKDEDVREHDGNLEGEYEHELILAEVVQQELRSLQATLEQGPEGPDASGLDQSFEALLPAPPPPSPLVALAASAAGEFPWESMDSLIFRVPGRHSKVLRPGSTSDFIGEVKMIWSARYQAVAKCTLHPNCSRMRAWKTT